MFHYIDDIISINNSKLGDFGDRIYPIEFEIKDITDTAMYVSYLDLCHECQLRTKFYARRDDFYFSHLYVATFEQLLHMVDHIMISVVEGCS